MSLSVRVVSRSGKELCVLQLSSDATTEDLKQAFAKKFPKFYPERQYYTIGADASRVTIAPEKKLTEYGLKGEGTVVFKDLGPQISWKTVFHVEYAGPIIVFVLFYFFPQLFYWGHKIPQHNYTQNVAFVLVVIHYIKRELETHYIHRFSLATMPLFNIFKNSTHYWIFGGAAIAYFQFHPLYTETKPAWFVNLCALAFLLMEAGNLYSHIILRNLRKPGSRDRGIPRGFLFEYVTCANYTFELAAWLIFAIFTQTLTAYLFFLISAAQISAWSVKKHKALRKEFGEKVPRRKILVPFIW